MMVHMWIYCSTHRPSLTDDLSVMTVMYTALSALLVVLFFVVRRATRAGIGLDGFPAPRAAVVSDVLAAAGMAVGAVLLAVPLGLPAVPTVAVASAAGGLGVAWAYMRWGQFYAKLDIRYAAPLIFASMALGSIGKAVVDVLPAVPAAAVMACLPFAAFACMRRSLASVPPAPKPDVYYNDRTVGSLARLAAGIAVFSLTTGVIQSVLLEAEPIPVASILVHHGSEVVLAVAMVAWVALFKRGLDFSRTWRLILILMATALIFEPHFDPGFLTYLLSLVRTAQTFLIVFLFLALADIARHSPYHPMAVFSLGWVAYTLPFMAGKAVGDELVAIGGQDAAVVMSAIVWLLVVVMLFVLDDSAVGNRLIFTELNDGGEDDTLAKRMGAVQQQLNEQSDANRRGTDVLALRCDALSKEYKLTPREREILELLVRGRSKAHIADAFLISENTVRGHVKHIYAKLGVHSKQELLDRAESVVI